jgi:WhiB family transcriptional regulator, redox-sensing transcriptional regulator
VTEAPATVPAPAPAPARVWPSSVGEFWSWHLQAACRQVDNGLFFSPDGERGPRKERREAAAKQICGTCPVLEVCAAYAIASREPYGTWGGLSEQDRRRLARRIDPGRAQLRYRTALAAWEAGSLRGRAPSRSGGSPPSAPRPGTP